MSYLTTVAQMTNHNVDYIWKRMPFAQGLQYQTAWYQMKGIKCVPISTREAPSGLMTVIL